MTARRATNAPASVLGGRSRRTRSSKAADACLAAAAVGPWREIRSENWIAPSALGSALCPGSPGPNGPGSGMMRRLWRLQSRPAGTRRRQRRRVIRHLEPRVEFQRRGLRDATGNGAHPRRQRRRVIRELWATPKVSSDKPSRKRCRRDSFPDVHSHFKWQRGYAGFSVGPSQLGKLVDYIDNQEEHHRHETFQDEYRRLLHLPEVDFDERWVWD